MSWGFPIIHCPHCHYVGKPALSEGTSTRTWTATCTACQVIIKQLPRLGEPAPVADEAASGGARLYAKTDLARAALAELARRKLRAMGVDPDAPRPHKHTGE